LKSKGQRLHGAFSEKVWEANGKKSILFYVMMHCNMNFASGWDWVRFCKLLSP